MILYFADRKMNILGQASTSLPEGVIISNDRKTEEVDEGVAILEFDLEYDPEWRKKAETWTEAGNYILRKDGDDREFYTIISREKDPVNGSVNDIYAEDAGLDLLNEVVGAYKADKAYSAEFYIKKFSYDSGFEVGVNEVSNLTRKLSWDGEATATERLLSVATQFDNAEISFSFDVDRMSVVHKYINIFKRRGVDSGVQLQIGREIKKIRIKDTIEDLATAYVCTGGIPDGKDDPITLAGYKYDDGDFYVKGTHLNSRKALQKWSRYQIKTEMGDNVGHIVKTFSYDTTSQSELCNRAVSSLKKICDVNTTYEIELSYLPRGTKIGDTVYIIDHTGELYLSSRLLKIETSVCDNTKTAELGEYSVKSSGVSEKLRELADAFAKVAQNRKFYTWIAYADDDIGTGASLDSYGKEYFGIASNRVTRDPDLTDPTVYTWIKTRGEQGIPGTDGKGIESIKEHYAVSTSNTVTPTVWFDDVPVTNPVNKYLWNYETITYTNGTSADSKKRVIGVYGDTGKDGAKGDGLDIKDTRATNESPNWYVKNYPKTTVMELKECQAIGLSNAGAYCNLQTIVLWSDNTVGYPRQTAKIEGTGKEYWRVGTSDTTWSSWIDPYGKSLEAAKTATNFMEFNSGTGLQIGDKTNGTWKGFRSRITSTAFEILNEAGAAVASYGRKLIQLGKDSVDAIIELCGGKGNIKYATPENNYIQQGLALDRGLVIESVDNIIIKPANKFFVNTELTDSTTDFVGRSSITPGSFQLNVWQSNKGSNIINASVGIEGNIEEGLNLEATGGKYDFLEAIRFNNISLLDWIYPVGSIYMSAKEGNPALLFGGTWVAWGAGRVPVGFNGSDGNFNSSEKTGGSKTINIEHNHGLSNARAAVGRADSSLSTMSYTSGGNPHNVYFDREFSYYGGISGGHKHATDTSLIYGNTNNGGSTAASVLQPYIVCYMWKRTA